MKFDAAGIALIITALGGSIGAFVNAWLQIRAARTHAADRDIANAKLDEVHALVQQVAATPDAK